MAVVLLADSEQNRSSDPLGRNAGHMVVIKTGVAEHSVYISILPKGLRSFMKGCASHSAQSAMLRLYRGRTESSEMKQECVFPPPAVSNKSIPLQ